MVFGVALILILSGVAAALSIWLSNDTGTGGVMLRSRTTQVNYTNAADLAIQSIRYVPQLSGGQGTLNANPPVSCGVGGEHLMFDELEPEVAVHTEHNTEDLKVLLQENTALTGQVKQNTDLLDELHRHVTEIGRHLGVDAGTFPPLGNDSVSN
jgi:hypothetical protein